MGGIKDERYYEDKFESLDEERKIIFLQEYGRREIGKISYLMSGILFFGSTIFYDDVQKTTGYKILAVLDLIYFAALVITEIIPLFVIVLLFLLIVPIVCRIYLVVKCDKIIEESNLRIKEDIFKKIGGNDEYKY